MFSLNSSGRAAAAPTMYSVNTTKSHTKNDSSVGSSADSLEPAIDGPPSPERIRAYTEQMKRSSIFGNNSRTNTLSSGASSFRSRESAYASTENLSRKSSVRSNTSGMPSPRERPESLQKLGSLFSRSGRKSRRDNSLGNLASPFIFPEGISEEESAAEHYHGTGHGSRHGALHNSPPRTQEGRRWPSISEPFNFQHVTHTRQDHLPDLARSSRMELVSEFSAIRASQTPAHGELKEIKVQDLHFNNFSSEALSTPLEKTPNTSPQGRRQRAVLRKSLSPPQRPVPLAKSHDNLRVAPPRPPRSPLSPTCPIALPPRTSSRTASVLFDTFDPVYNTSIERPRTAGAFQRPAPFDHPLIFEQQEHVPNHETLHALTPPGDDAWPLTAPLAGKCAMELTDVKEEEEETMKASRASSELRASRSVPSLQSNTYEQVQDIRASTVLLPGLSSRASALRRSPLSPGFRFDQDWEKDIDYCYENEIEADCDYQWVEEQNVTVDAPSLTPQPQMDLHLEDDNRPTYHGRFRPSLIVPSAYEVPELSPMSNISAVSSDLRSPAAFLQPNPIRSSYASSFKESHGFNLSPSLLIPTDFRSQMEQDSLYGDQYGTNHSTSAAVFGQQEPYCHYIPPSDETSSSIVSYRSSNFSRGSARSSSSTRLSATNSRNSKDSAMFLSQTSINETHRSIGSASSLPDLVPSAVWRLEKKPDTGDLGNDTAAPNQGEDLVVQVSDFVPTPHRRYKSLAPEARVAESIGQFSPQIPLAARSELVDENSTLSPVAESFIDTTKQGKTHGQVHGRKSSAPVVSHSAREKGRARASTLTLAGSTPGGKKKAGYMLFPQV
ncbi:hypothetical protein LHYA1_G003770 [Lachnellula hyalina]|uniref:CRIB domain-containing protein n=1 Tax=Lachnellula hyalina TaxID=1316788 RepID=A0A8H8R5B7_9HELO|nr:uncharacterized protein LHYA1_G003770 [Lachnellula hyalina]TVY27795.1 hypothetical protein LHYA1_G003770 [Lachnellula hyalina]